MTEDIATLACGPVTSNQAIDASRGCTAVRRCFPLQTIRYLCPGSRLQNMCHRLSNFRDQLPVGDGPKLFQAMRLRPYLSTCGELARSRWICAINSATTAWIAILPGLSTLQSVLLPCGHVHFTRSEIVLFISDCLATWQIVSGLSRRQLAMSNVLTPPQPPFILWFRLAWKLKRPSTMRGQD